MLDDPAAPLAPPQPFDVAKFIADWQWESGDGPTLFHGEYHEKRAVLHRFAERLLEAALRVGAPKEEQP